MTALYVLAAILGAIVGSFLNVVIYRLPLDEPLGMTRKTRSKCPACDALIAWYDNIPIVSYLVLGGRCRACKGAIAKRYPLVEATSAALFVLCLWRVYAEEWDPWWLAFLVTSAFSAVLLAASVIDFQHKILPDKITLRVGPIVAGLGALLVPDIHGTVLFGHDLATSMKAGMASLLVGVVGALVGGGIIGAIRWAGTAVMRREAMGLGDVKFMAMAGLLLGPVGTLFGIGVALVGGSVLGILIWAITRNREIPFGPFLAMGALSVLLFGDSIRHFVLVTYPSWISG